MWFFDDIYYNKWKNINDNSIIEYKKTSSTNEAKIFIELNKLTPEQKLSIWLWSENKAKEVLTKMTNDPLWAIKDSISNWWLHLGLIFWIIWAIFWGKKWFFWWLLWWILVWGWWIWAITQLFKDQKGASKETLQQSQKPTLQNTKSPELTSKNPFFWVINFSHENNQTKKLELEKIWWDLSRNEKFLSAKTNILNIFELNPPKNFQEIKDTLKVYGIELTLENKDFYKITFSEVLKQRKSVWIWEPIETEDIKTYLTRTSKILPVWVVATTPLLAEDRIEDLVSWTIDKTKTKEELFVEFNQQFNNFKLKINEIKNSQNFYWWSSKEQKEKDSRDLALVYQNLYKYIEYFDSLKENLSQAQKSEVNTIKLYFAKFYSGKWVVENDYNKNYFKSIWLALQLLPEINKPKFPWEFELAERIKWQVWIFNYISKEVSENNRDINEILQDKEIAGKILDIKWKQVDEYEAKLESYLLWLDEKKLDETQKEALKLLKDIQWIWVFDIKESNFDTAKGVWWTLISIWGWIVATWVASQVIPVAWWIWWTLAAVVWWVTATTWIMLSRWDNYFADWDDWLKELGINTATFWVWGAIYKWARAIQWWRALFTSWRWIGALSAEMAWDILLWSSVDMMRGYFEWINIPFNEAFKSNLIWWLVPLWVAWGGQLKNSFSNDRLKLAQDILRQSKWAEFLQAMGNPSWAKKIWEKLLLKIDNVRIYDIETQNLLNPLKNNLEDIRAIPEGWNIVLWNTKVTLKNWIYLFEESWFIRDLWNFLSSNKWRNWAKYTIKWEELTFDITPSWQIRRIVRADWTTKITNWKDITNFLYNYRNISKDLLDKAIKISYVRPYIIKEVNKLKIWESFDIWWQKITKTSLWYKVDALPTEFKKIEDAIEKIDPQKIINYWKTHINLEISRKLWDKYFNLDWKEYYFDDSIKVIKMKDSNGNFVNVPASFIDENFEALFQHRYWVPFSLWLNNFKGNISSMKLWDFLLKMWKKAWDLWTVKPWSWLFSLNTLMSEIFALPKVIKQLSEVNYKSLSSYKKDLPKIILFWDVNQTLSWFSTRTWVIALAVTWDWLIWDSGDSEVWDALSYMYGWIITQAVWQFFFDEK